MSTQRRVPYLSRLNNEGTREKRCKLYVTKGGKDDSMIFHIKEENNYYQYRRLNVYKKKVTLMCIYKRNKRGKCKAELTPVVADNLWTCIVFEPSVALRLNQAYNQRFIINIYFFNDNHIKYDYH